MRLDSEKGLIEQKNSGFVKEETTMRKCLRCHAEMAENLDIKVQGGAYGIKVTQQGIFKDSLGKLNCAVCPECGYIEIYMEDTDKIKKLMKKENTVS